MTLFSVHKKTSRGLKQDVASGRTLSQAQDLLEQIRHEYRRDDIECSLSHDLNILTAANPHTSAFKVTYRIVPCETPASLTGPAADRAFRRHCLNRDCTNFALLKHRDYQGFLVSGQHSGTHWVKWMLSHAMANHYGVAPPRYFDNVSSNALIGHPRHRRQYPHLPRIASSHSIPPYALQWRWLRRLLPLPPYVLVVRDIRSVLISNFEKWRHRYGVSFTQYVAGDPTGKAYITDAWNYVHFLNRWGEIASRYPVQTLILRYEDFQTDKVASLARVARHFSLPLTVADLEAGAAAGSKEFMARHRDPAVSERALRPDGEGDMHFSADNSALLKGILDRNLHHDFGYDYLERPRGFQIQPLNAVFGSE